MVSWHQGVMASMIMDMVIIHCHDPAYIHYTTTILLYERGKDKLMHL